MTNQTLYRILAKLTEADAIENAETAARLDADNDPKTDEFQYRADALFARADMFRDKAAA